MKYHCKLYYEQSEQLPSDRQVLPCINRDQDLGGSPQAAVTTPPILAVQVKSVFKTKAIVLGRSQLL